MQPDHDAPSGGYEITYHLRALRRWAPWVLLAGIVGGVVMYANAARQDEVFESATEVIVSQPPDLDYSFVERPLSRSAERTIENEIQLLGSASIREQVVDAGGPSIGVSARNKGESDVIVITHRGADPETIATELNDFTDTYIDLRRAQTLEEFASAAARIEEEQREVAGRLIALQAPIDELNAQIAVTTDEQQLSNLQSERDRLDSRTINERNELESRVAEYEDFLVQVEGASEQVDGGLRVITAGAVSSEPVAPSPKRDAILGFSVGIVLGIVLMLCIDYVDDRVRGPEDMERALPDEPLYGEIPNLEALATSPVLDLDDQRADTDTLAGVEAYRALATSLEFANIDDAPRILQVTSPIAGEGKSTTVANLASAFAATGIRVALVDADLRRPKMHEFFAVDNDAGLTTFVVGRTDLAESVSHPTGHPGLTVLTAGPATPDAAKVLHSEATEKLLDRLRQDHDLVILDTPPVLPLADALIVAQLTDLVVLVARAGSTGRRSLRSARAAIENVDGPPLAVVLNNAPRSGIGHDDYYGTYANSRDTSTATPEGEPSRRRFRGRAKSST